jgi:integrase/recombinase XerD
MEVVMLEHYFIKPATIDRIRANWLGPHIEQYVEWLNSEGYAERNVFRRVPILCQFGEFVQHQGVSDLASATAYVELFAAHWLKLHGKGCCTDAARHKVIEAARNPVRQLLNLALEGCVKPERKPVSFPFLSEAPGFVQYLKEERGLQPSSVLHYRYGLRRFDAYLTRVCAHLAEVSPALLAAFVVDQAPELSRAGRRNLCGVVRVFLRYCRRERILREDLSAAVEMPHSYRLADIPRAITWEQVRIMLQVVDRRTVRGRRDYAILLLLVTYGLRAHEVVKLTLDDFDWQQERFQVPARKAGHWSAYPLANVVAEAIIDYLQHGRPQTTDRHLFFRVLAPHRPITNAAVSSSVADYLRKAGIHVHRPGAHTLRHTCVQRLIDAEFPLKTIGDYVGHGSPQSTEIYLKVALSALREVAQGDGEAL